VTRTKGAGDPVPSGYQLLDKPVPPVHDNRGIMGSFADPVPLSSCILMTCQRSRPVPYFTWKLESSGFEAHNQWASYHTGRSHENIVSLTIEAWNGGNDTNRTTIASFGDERSLQRSVNRERSQAGDQLYRTEFDRSLPHTTLSVHGCTLRKLPSNSFERWR
jgi:hypothetical protein